MVNDFGTVHLVGAGPGDPGLLTMRADRLLRDCDCVVHDYLVNHALLTRVPAGARIVDVGKRGGERSISQEAINRLLIELAGSHRCIVRLKGGDPFLFGRGGEEADALAAAGVPFSVVPGVTSGIAVPAYAGIPITHRAASSAVVFATAHREPGKDETLHWDALARVETIVLYMGMQRLDEVCAALIRHGRVPTTPACVVQWGTYTRQRTVTGTLATLADAVRTAGLGAPAITVIGDVVSYREHIRWFDTRPLFGRTVVVTRAEHQAGRLYEAFEALGAQVIAVPVTQIEPPARWDELDAALAALPLCSWTAFTSANAVDAVFNRLRALGRDARAFAVCRIAAIGSATANRLTAQGLRPDLVPAAADGAALAAAIIQDGSSGTVLLPQADNATPTLADALRAAHVSVQTVCVYRSTPITATYVLPETHIDAITFASAATCERFVARVGRAALKARLAIGTRCYAIGPHTATAMRSLGLSCHGVAETAEIAALSQLVVRDLGQCNSKA